MKSKLILKKTTLKKCACCNRSLPLECFHKDSYGKYGRRYKCKECSCVKPEDRKIRTGNLTSNKRFCATCGAEFQPTSNRQKYCKECSRQRDIKRCREYYKRTTVLIGRDHLRGENSPNFKTGIGIYHRLKDEIGKRERCGSLENLCVHHKNRNRKDNNRGNLEVICKACHQKEHLIRDSLGRFHSSK